MKKTIQDITKVQGSIYISHFSPSPNGLRILTEGKILANGESPQSMVERIVQALVMEESRFGISTEEISTLAKEFGELLDEKYCLMSTPISTNAGRHTNKPLSACTVLDLDLNHDDIKKIEKAIFTTHQYGMGTGFSLNEVTDPVATLRTLNHIAILSAQTGKEDRPVGNMATLSVYHPRILEFVNAKIASDNMGETWKFNISVDCDTNFFNAVKTNGSLTQKDGSIVKARTILRAICTASSVCADPGLIFMEKVEADNPTPCVGHYNSTAPCAEVGLAKGEFCQFAYLNIARFLTKDLTIDTDKLKRAVHLLTRVLDNALEISLENYHDHTSQKIMHQKRKIGIGICGLADLFIQKGLYYDSNEARMLALDIVSLINFESKIASHKLAHFRGSCGAMSQTIGNEYVSTPSFLERKYTRLDTKYVKSKDWEDLAKKIKETRLLRNVSTVALPPTGRSSLTIDASTGIEPIFSRQVYLETHNKLTQTQQEFIQTATEISSNAHIQMAANIQKGVDESISKTINLPAHSTPEEIEQIYLLAWDSGLKGISIYREGSKKFQPKQLK